MMLLHFIADAYFSFFYVDFASLDDGQYSKFARDNAHIFA